MIKVRVLTPVKTRVVSANDYLALTQKRRNAIESSTFIPPKIGKKGFGKVKVTFKDMELTDAE